jgi:putative transposase
MPSASISRSSFYYAPRGETAMNIGLMLLIDKQFLDAPFYGIRQITWHLQNLCKRRLGPTFCMTC